MISTKMISGWVSAILASASKPSVAVITVQPTFFSKVSAVRRMVLLSSITMIFRFSKFSSIGYGPKHVSVKYCYPGLRPSAGAKYQEGNQRRPDDSAQFLAQNTLAIHNRPVYIV